MPERMLTPPRLCCHEKKAVATKHAKPNHRKAVEAWASWQRFSVLGEPLVTRLLRV